MPGEERTRSHEEERGRVVPQHAEPASELALFFSSLLLLWPLPHPSEDEISHTPTHQDEGSRQAGSGLQTREEREGACDDKTKSK